jgi:hypothetical protein
MSRWKMAGAIAGAALAAGCAQQPPAVEKPAPAAELPAVPPGLPKPVSEADNLLVYYYHVRGISGAELGREHEIARQAYARSRSDFNRVRYAMLLTVPNAVFADDARALEMLEPVARNTNGQLQGLAYLLLTHLQERKRLEANAQALQQKLDALRSLERSMIERKR